MCVFFFFKQKTAYEMRISDWSSDVCSSDLDAGRQKAIKDELEWIRQSPKARQAKSKARIKSFDQLVEAQEKRIPGKAQIVIQVPQRLGGKVIEVENRSEEHTSELQSLMRISYAVFCLKKKKQTQKEKTHYN